MLYPSGRGLHAGRFARFWASAGAKFTKICDSVPWTPMNHRAKGDAVSFILGRDIRNRTDTLKKRNSK